VLNKNADGICPKQLALEALEITKSIIAESNNYIQAKAYVNLS